MELSENRRAAFVVVGLR